MAKPYSDDFRQKVTRLNLVGVQVTLLTAGNCQMGVITGKYLTGAIAFSQLPQLPQNWAVAVGAWNPTLQPSIASHGSFSWGLVGFPIASRVSLAGLVG